MGSSFRSGLMGMLILALTTSPAGFGIGAEFDYSSLIDQLSPAVVSVKALQVSADEESWVGGSGVVIDTSGKVITSCHIVLGAADVVVELQSGKEYAATVERCSEEDTEAKMRDVALLQLKGEKLGLSRAWLGNSDGIYLGEGIFSLSYPGPYGEFNVSTGDITGRLKRHYLTIGSHVYRASLLIHTEIAWTDESHGSLGSLGEALDLEAAHPSLRDLQEFAEQNTVVLALEEPFEDEPFCGVVSSASSEIAVDEIDCFGLFVLGRIAKTGNTGKLNRELLFLKTSAPLSRGSSGGPILNLNGQILGIVGWGRDVEIIEAQNGQIEDVRFWQSTNFVIPSNSLRQILPDEGQ